MYSPAACTVTCLREQQQRERMGAASTLHHAFLQGASVRSTVLSQGQTDWRPWSGAAVLLVGMRMRAKFGTQLNRNRCQCSALPHGQNLELARTSYFIHSPAPAQQIRGACRNFVQRRCSGNVDASFEAHGLKARALRQCRGCGLLPALARLFVVYCNI